MKQFILKLYIAGRIPRTEQAISSLNEICEKDLASASEVAVIDAAERPQLAENEKILATPTRVKEILAAAPAGRRRPVRIGIWSSSVLDSAIQGCSFPGGRPSMNGRRILEIKVVEKVVERHPGFDVTALAVCRAGGPPRRRHGGWPRRSSPRSSWRGDPPGRTRPACSSPSRSPPRTSAAT